MVQLHLFPEILKSVSLVASQSPKKATYRLWMDLYNGKFRVGKESGTVNKTLDKRIWEFESIEEAEKYFDSKFKAKTNPDRKSPRKYQKV